MQSLGPFTQRDRQDLRQMNPANRVANQPPRGSCSVRLHCHICLLRLDRCRVAQHPCHRATQERHAPGQDQQPEQKSHQAGKKAHRISSIVNRPLSGQCARRRSKPLCPLHTVDNANSGTPSVCNRKRVSQANRCKFNSLRDLKTLRFLRQTGRKSSKPSVYNVLWEKLNYGTSTSLLLAEASSLCSP